MSTGPLETRRMDPHQITILFDLLKDMANAMHTLGEEARELRKEHTALRQQMELIQAAVSHYVGTS